MSRFIIVFLIAGCGLSNEYDFAKCDYLSDFDTCIHSSYPLNIDAVNLLETALSELGVAEFSLELRVIEGSKRAGFYVPAFRIITVVWHENICRMALAHEYAHFYQDVMGVDELVHDSEFRKIEFYLLGIIGCVEVI